jgi:hypothetical protein
MDLLRIYLDSRYNLVISVAVWLLVVIAVLVLVAFVMGRFSRRFVSSFEINQAEFGLGNQKITIRPSNEDRQVAYRLWVEMATRKIGLPVDETHDVITEIYSSWYDFFRVARELLKALPISALRRSTDSKTLVKITVELLNEQIRPHLTTWQARFRKWYEAQCRLPVCEDLTPQEVQRRFPEYQALMADMRQTNERLIKYREMLRDLAIG